MYRRAAFLDGIGPVDEAIPGSYGEDYEWVLRAARRGPVVTVQEPLVRVYTEATSADARDALVSAGEKLVRG